MKFFIVGLILFLSIIAFYFFSESHNLPVDDARQLSPSVPQNLSVEHSHAAIKNTKPLNTPELPVESESKKNIVEKPAWKLNNNIQPAMSLAPEIIIYEPVEIEHQDLYPQPGERLALPLPKADTVIVKIESSEIHSNGDYTWSGHLQGYGNDYPVVTTYGKQSTFSTITTPQGSYTLEVVNGQGWIYKNPSVFELSAPGHEDGLEIPENF
jgi:hypothetical protein